VYYVLKRNGLNKLPKNERKRSLPAFKRYEKQVPGHRIQIDVKFLSFKDPAGKMQKMYQYTAIDDATRARALKIYPKHNQQTAIEFVDYLRERLVIRLPRNAIVTAGFRNVVNLLGVIQHLLLTSDVGLFSGAQSRTS
jgi:hypothetical protein